MPIAAVAMIVEGSVAADALVGGLMIASGALSLAGEVTGNKTLSELGAVAGIGSGVAGLASGGFLGSAAQGAEQSASSSFSSLFTPATVAPADAVAAGAATTGDIAPLATSGAASSAADTPGMVSPTGMDLTAQAPTDTTAGLLGGASPNASAVAGGSQAVSAPDVAATGGAAAQSTAPLAAGAADATGAPVAGATAGATAGAITNPAAQFNQLGYASGAGLAPGIAQSTGNASLDLAINQAAASGAVPQSGLAGLWAKFQALDPATKNAIATGISKGADSISNYIGPKADLMKAQTQLAQNQGGLIGQQLSNMRAPGTSLVPAVTYTRS